MPLNTSVLVFSISFAARQRPFSSLIIFSYFRSCQTTQQSSLLLLKIWPRWVKFQVGNTMFAARKNSIDSCIDVTCEDDRKVYWFGIRKFMSELYVFTWIICLEYVLCRRHSIDSYLSPFNLKGVLKVLLTRSWRVKRARTKSGATANTKPPHNKLYSKGRHVRAYQPAS